ncbi:MAG: radical SAM protein [Candidatus Thermoplasmatota archaeon]
MKITEIYCKTALSKSLLPGFDYALNPYRGCEHSCIYCYASAVLREPRKWGSFIDVKIDIPTILAKELSKKKRGVVGIGTVTDAYQPIEKKYELTRKCLYELLKHDFPISIQTKASLILRDLEIIKKFSEKDVGVTITTIDEELRKKYETYSSTVEERFEALEKFAHAGIETWVFIGPVMPYITDRNNNLEKLIDKIALTGTKRIIVDRLRLKKGTWGNIKEFVLENYPELLPKYKEIFFCVSDYFEKVHLEIEKLCKDYKIKCERAF